MRETFQGSKGIIDLNDAGAASIIDLEGKNIFEYRNQNDLNPYQVEHDKLFASIRNKEVISDAENGAKSTMTAIMGRMATYSGQLINWEEAMTTENILMPKEVTWDFTPPTVPGTYGSYPIPMPGKTVVF